MQKKTISFFLTLFCLLILTACSKSNINSIYKSTAEPTISVQENTKNNNGTSDSIHPGLNNNYNDDLSLDDEEVLFSFKTGSPIKTMSVCISKNAQDYIIYRFGTKEKVELEFPENKSDSWNKFTYSYYLRGGGKENEGVDMNYLTFINGGYQYQIYQEYSAKDSTQSVGVKVIDLLTNNETNIKGLTNTTKGSLIDLRQNKKIHTVMTSDRTIDNAKPENTSHGNGMFAMIINAYAGIERSGYTSLDKDIIGDSLLAIDKGNTYNFGSKPTLMYAFYDINSDGSPELLIGANKSISGIYVLQTGMPVSVIQVESRHYLSLLMDSDGKSVIEDIWGHMGYATNFFYTIDEDGKLLTLNKLYTNGDDKKGDKFIGHFRAKDVQGKEVSITEEEYCSLIRKYGSRGYEPFEDTGKERKIDIIWQPVATYDEKLNNNP